MLDPIALAQPLVEAALAEDVGTGDATSQSTIPAGARAEAVIVAKEAGVLAGLPVARMVFHTVDPNLEFEPDLTDGDAVTPGTVVARITGSTRSLLTAERTALNFLQHLSGIASATAQAVAALEGTGIRVLDTRKTVPGMRLLAKYAVRCGGGQNHRRGLDDMILIKENHVAAAGGVAAAIRKARAARPDLKLEIEVTDRAELEEAAAESPDRIMLDNFTPDEVRRATKWLESRPGATPEIEISGGLTAETVRAYAAAGVDYVSFGAITHSAGALDLSLLITPESK